jgi:hypothetical protein
MELWTWWTECLRPDVLPNQGLEHFGLVTDGVRQLVLIGIMAFLFFQLMPNPLLCMLIEFGSEKWPQESKYSVEA